MDSYLAKGGVESIVGYVAEYREQVEAESTGTSAELS